MTDNEIFYKLFNGGNHSLPYLIEFKLNDAEGTVYRFVNNNQNIVYEGKTFIASTFEYSRPNIDGSGGSLTISGADNNLIEFIEQADHRWSLSVVGVIAEAGNIQPINQFVHFFGTVSYSDNMELEFELGSDDRLDMTFPPYMFDTDNNLGNA